MYVKCIYVCVCVYVYNVDDDETWMARTDEDNEKKAAAKC